MLVQHLHVDERCFSSRDLICDGFSSPPGHATHAATRSGRFSLAYLPFSPAQKQVILQIEVGGNPPVTDAPWGRLCVCPWVRGGLRSGEVPDQMLLLSAVSTLHINNPRSPYFVTFISQPCQTSSVQIKTYRIHTSVPDKHPCVFGLPSQHGVMVIPLPPRDRPPQSGRVAARGIVSRWARLNQIQVRRRWGGLPGDGAYSRVLTSVEKVW